MARRGLFFWALNLHRADCPTCKRETLYRHDYPLTCRWCGAFMIDFKVIAATMNRWVDAFAETMASMVKACESASTTFAEWAASLAKENA